MSSKRKKEQDDVGPWKLDSDREARAMRWLGSDTHMENILMQKKEVVIAESESDSESESGESESDVEVQEITDNALKLDLSKAGEEIGLVVDGEKQQDGKGMEDGVEKGGNDQDAEDKEIQEGEKPKLVDGKRKLKEQPKVEKSESVAITPTEKLLHAVITPTKIVQKRGVQRRKQIPKSERKITASREKTVDEEGLEPFPSVHLIEKMMNESSTMNGNDCSDYQFKLKVLSDHVKELSMSLAKTRKHNDKIATENKLLRLNATDKDRLLIKISKREEFGVKKIRAQLQKLAEEYQNYKVSVEEIINKNKSKEDILTEFIKKDWKYKHDCLVCNQRNLFENELSIHEDVQKQAKLIEESRNIASSVENFFQELSVSYKPDQNIKNVIFQSSTMAEELLNEPILNQYAIDKFLIHHVPDKKEEIHETKEEPIKPIKKIYSDAGVQCSLVTGDVNINNEAPKLKPEKVNIASSKREKKTRKEKKSESNSENVEKHSLSEPLSVTNEETVETRGKNSPSKKPMRVHVKSKRKSHDPKPKKEKTYSPRRRPSFQKPKMKSFHPQQPDSHEKNVIKQKEPVSSPSVSLKDIIASKTETESKISEPKKSADSFLAKTQLPEMFEEKDLLLEKTEEKDNQVREMNVQSDTITKDTYSVSSIKSMNLSKTISQETSNYLPSRARIIELKQSSPKSPRKELKIPKYPPRKSSPPRKTVIVYKNTDHLYNPNHVPAWKKDQDQLISSLRKELSSMGSKVSKKDRELKESKMEIEKLSKTVERMREIREAEQTILSSLKEEMKKHELSDDSPYPSSSSYYMQDETNSILKSLGVDEDVEIVARTTTDQEFVLFRSSKISPIRKTLPLPLHGMPKQTKSLSSRIWKSSQAIIHKPAFELVSRKTTEDPKESSYKLPGPSPRKHSVRKKSARILTTPVRKDEQNYDEIIVASERRKSDPRAASAGTFRVVRRNSLNLRRQSEPKLKEKHPENQNQN